MKRLLALAGVGIGLAIIARATRTRFSTSDEDMHRWAAYCPDVVDIMPDPYVLELMAEAQRGVDAHDHVYTWDPYIYGGDRPPAGTPCEVCGHEYEPPGLTAAEEATVAQAARLAAPIFAAMGWTWGGGAGRHCPAEGEIAARLTGLAQELKVEGWSNISTGRFTVHYGTDDQEFRSSWLSIVLELASAEDM